MKVRVALVLLLALGTPLTARALVWPDVTERVVRDLAAADPATRLAAARELTSLGPIRGAPLALQALGDADTDVRLAAADAAMRLRATGATDAVTSWLNAPDARLRRKACEVARVLPTPRAVTGLARSLGDPDPEVRIAAAEALGHQASGDAVPPLLGRLDDPAPAARIQIVAALARLGDVRAVVPLVGKVQDSSPEVREAVVRALGDLGDTRASSALVLALRDQNNDVRRDALASLGRMRAADAVDAIAPFTQERAPSLRLAAIGALGRIASAEAVRILVAGLGSGDDATALLEHTPIRDALVAAGPAAAPVLDAILARSPSAASAAGAAWVFGEAHATGEAAAIVDAMRRGALPAAAALHALAGAGTAAEVPIVLEFVTDASSVVRGEALAAAAALLDPNRPDGRAVEPLEAALRDARPSAQERARIATLLGRTGASRAAPLLAKLTRAQDATLRIAAIDAMGTLGPDAVTPGARREDSAEKRSAVDDALLEAIGSADAVVRLHAAIALAEAGGGRARDALLTRLDGGNEVDRAAVLTALGGVLARAPSDAAVAKLVEALELAAGPERDAILEALGRARVVASTKALGAVASSMEPADRLAVATMLASHPADAAALATVRALLGDSVGAVRAQAAWSLGTLGDGSDLVRLDALAHGVVAPEGTVLRDAAFARVDVACNAAAAIGRIAARIHAPDAASRALCSLVTMSDAYSYVRANALAGLALAGARCANGAQERAVLASDPSDEARASAALLLSGSPNADDTRALQRCAREDPSGQVAARCRTRAPLPARTRPVLVYVFVEGASAPRPDSAYAIALADGTLHVGTTDRRGAVFDPVTPEGEVSLRKPSALAK